MLKDCSAPSRLRLLHFLQEERGSELLEFALALPVLLTVTFGAIGLLLFLACYGGATYGSREGVRYASTHGAASLAPCTSETLISIVQPYLINLPGETVTITPQWTPDNTVGSIVLIKVSLSYPTNIPFTSLSSLSVFTTATGVIMQ